MAVDKIESLRQKELARIEIENLLCGIEENIEGNGVKNEIRQKESSLAVSAQKGLREKKAKNDLIRLSISKALKSGGRRSLNPTSLKSFLIKK